MTSRDRILKSLRHALHRRSDDGAREAVEARLTSHPRNLVPERGGLAGEALLGLFIAQAEAVDSTVARIRDETAVPAAVSDFLKKNNLPPKIRIAPHPALQSLPWAEGAPLLEVTEGSADPQDAVSVTPAFAAVAETGTLVLLSGQRTPTTLNFLPETHVVLLRANQVVGAYEDAWDRLRKLKGDCMPRALNMVTGPSRTADIEQRIELGAHGPRRLHIILLEDDQNVD